MGEIIELSGYLSSDQAAERLGVSRRYLYRIRKYLPPSTVGRALLYKREDIEAYAASHPRLGQVV